MKAFIVYLPKLVILVLGLFLLLMYSTLGRDYLFDWDEAIYAELGREMQLTHNYLTPTWNQELWLEKPPLIAWTSALGSTLVQDSELGSRFMMPIFAALTLYLIYQIGTIIGGVYVGAISLSLLATFDLFLSRARSLNTDMILLLGIALTLYLLLKNHSPWKVALALTLAVFAKGLAGLLALIIAIPLLVNKSRKYTLHLALYSMLFILPWHLYQYFVNGVQFTTPYLLEQVIRRATVPIEFHLESRWFYFIHLYKDLGLGVILALGLGIINLRRKNLFLLFWVLVPLIIFTLAKTRLTWYILPIYPGIALIIGNLIVKLAKQPKPVLITILTLGLLAQLLLESYNYVSPSSSPSKLPDKIIVANELRVMPGNNIAFLVSASERVAEAILPTNQRISSSFRYGGAPSVVYYAQKKVNFYYNYDDFNKDLSQGLSDLVIITPEDLVHVPVGYKIISTTNSYLGLTKESLYAKR